MRTTAAEIIAREGTVESLERALAEVVGLDEAKRLRGADVPELVDAASRQLRAACFTLAMASERVFVARALVLDGLAISAAELASAIQVAAVGIETESPLDVMEVTLADA